jgi:hypothetical protein
MQSSSYSSSPELRIEELLRPHEYIRDSSSFKHKDCISYRNRTEYTCIKCGYCYSCHWKREQLEEIELRDNLRHFYVSMSKATNNKEDNDNQKLKVKKQDGASKDDRAQGLERWGTLDVLGQPAEPICTYSRCHHKFSLHGTRSCRCKHPMNKTLGILVGYE